MNHLESVLISALEHWSYCPRQCALIHVESVWDENQFTLRGSLRHQRADEPITRTERGVRVERALPVWSDRLGLIGKCDALEFGLNVLPIEYKSGNSQHQQHASLQLAAQAICLEEMLGVSIEVGCLFFFESKRRAEVQIHDALRLEVEQATEEIRAMQDTGFIPEPAEPRLCRRCSLRDACLPEVLRNPMPIAPDWAEPAKEAELP